LNKQYAFGGSVVPTSSPLIKLITEGIESLEKASDVCEAALEELENQ
jgi:hypothetical protein